MASKQLNASKPALFNELAELEKLRTSLGRFQTERRTLADENSQLKAEIAALKEEIATLSSENAQLLAQADARAQLMQSIQSTLGPLQDDTGHVLSSFDEDYLSEASEDMCSNDEGAEGYQDAEGEDVALSAAIHPEKRQKNLKSMRNDHGLPSPSLSGTSSSSQPTFPPHEVRKPQWDDSDDGSLTSMSDDEADTGGQAQPRRSKRVRNDAATYKYLSKRPRHDSPEVERIIKSESISTAGPSSLRKKDRLSAPAERNASVKNRHDGSQTSQSHNRHEQAGQSKRNAHDSSPTISRQRRQTLIEQKRRADLAEVCADWPFRTKKAGCYTNWIQCDGCKRWVHHGCAGMMPKDPRLEPKAKYMCPPCSSGVRFKRKMGQRNDKCFRPDCDHKD